LLDDKNEKAQHYGWACFALYQCYIYNLGMCNTTIEGNVNTGGGAFTGRDVIHLHLTINLITNNIICPDSTQKIHKAGIETSHLFY